MKGRKHHGPHNLREILVRGGQGTQPWEGGEGALGVQREGKRAREFRREATRIHCKREGGEGEEEHVGRGM